MKAAVRHPYDVHNAAANSFAFLTPVIDHEIRYGVKNRRREPREEGKLKMEKREFA